MICNDGQVALKSFFIFSVVSFALIYYLADDVKSTLLSQVPFAFLPLSALQTLNFLPDSEVSLRAGFIGVVFGESLATLIFYTKCWNMSLYLASLAFFHISEYLVVAVYNPEKLDIDSFLLNHSASYSLAFILSLCEYFLGYYISPVMKESWVIVVIGIVLCIFGQLLRKASMVSAGKSFTHLVQYEKREKHKLVTDGVYGYFRHPGYVGWFYWSIGSQLLLCNPVCLIGYVAASWHFFNERIPEEEYYLIQFFGDDYINYMKKTGTGLPLIYGLEKEITKFEKAK